MAITIRKYVRSDYEEVYSLIASIFALEFSAIPAEGYLKDIEGAETNYSGENQGFWVAVDEQSKKIVGVAGVKNEYEGVAMLRRIFVHPQFRKQGVAKQLFEKVKNFCKNHEYQEIVFLGNQEMRAAKDALVSFGFRMVDGVQVGALSMFKMAYSL